MQAVTDSNQQKEMTMLVKEHLALGGFYVYRWQGSGWERIEGPFLTRDESMARRDALLRESG